MTTDEAVAILERYIEWSYCEELDAVPLRDWLTTDIVRMIELLDEELQVRHYAEEAIAAGAWSSDE